MSEPNLILDDRNANKGTARGRALVEESIEQTGMGRSVVADKNRKVIAGNTTSEIAIQKGMKIREVETDGTELIVVVRKDLDLDKPGGRARRLAYYDNRTSELGLDWDLETLAEDLQEDEMDFGSMWTGDEFKNMLGDLYDGEEEERYSIKVEAPIYEVTGDEPAPESLYDSDKAMELSEQINQLGDELDPQVAQFLRLAAFRHVVFDYSKIAEFYAHAPPNIQELMENSMLVIVDFDKAIEGGFVNLTSRLDHLYEQDEESAPS